MNLVIKQTRVVEVPVTTLNVCQSIMAMTTMLDADGAVCGHAIFPTWIPQVLEIDLATGQIKNWQVPTGDQLQHIADAYADGQSAAVAQTKLQAAVAIVEPEPTSADTEDAPLSICQPARPRYRNPDDHSQTWTGRGKPPPWLQAKLDNGAQLGDYRIAIN